MASLQANYEAFFSQGIKGIWLGLLYAFYAYGGIEVMGLMVIDLKNPKEAPKAGRIMLSVITIIFIMAIALALALVAWKDFSIDESPFITALQGYHIPFVADIFNGVLIIAGFQQWWPRYTRLLPFSLHLLKTMMHRQYSQRKEK